MYTQLLFLNYLNPIDKCHEKKIDLYYTTNKKELKSINKQHNLAKYTIRNSA